MAHLNSELKKIPGAIGFAFSPPAIPGIGAAGGVTFILEDRAGKDIMFLAGNVRTFHRSSPEAAGAGKRDHHLSPHRASDIRGCGPRQGAQAGHKPGRCI